jgi:hypothetical protein
MSGAVGVRLEQARMIARRLERLSADSVWAHAASGHRGSLLKLLDRLEERENAESTPPAEVELLDFLIDQGFRLLAQAAREIGDPELVRGLERGAGPAE